MPNLKKFEQVKKIQEKVKKAKSMVFVDYKGLTHKQLEEIRKKLLQVKGEFKISKNTLLKIALNKKELKDLSGPTGVLFAYEDEISPLAEMALFIKKYQLPKIKLGFFNNTFYNETQVTKLSTLPSKTVLLSQLVGQIMSPLSGLVYVLNSNLQKLVLVLNEVKNKKE